MSLVSLSDVLKPANQHGYGVAGLVVLGWEDARAYVRAAEEVRVPVILQAGPGCRENTPLPVLAKMFRHLAEHASVPVVAHLDHGYEIDECFEAIDLGFSSVMFDGSKMPIDDNIECTAKIVARAKAAGVSVEGEVGYVGYADGANSSGTNPEEARRFSEESGADAMAISIGNVHLHQTKAAVIDFDRLAKIKAVSKIPLVVHGGSGIPIEIRQRMAMESLVVKFNVGTEVRMAFGQGLRRVLSEDPELFDRVTILTNAEKNVYEAAKVVMRSLLGDKQPQLDT